MRLAKQDWNLSLMEGITLDLIINILYDFLIQQTILVW